MNPYVYNIPADCYIYRENEPYFEKLLICKSDKFGDNTEIFKELNKIPQVYAYITQYRNSYNIYQASCLATSTHINMIEDQMKSTNSKMNYNMFSKLQDYIFTNRKNLDILYQRQVNLTDISETLIKAKYPKLKSRVNYVSYLNNKYNLDIKYSFRIQKCNEMYYLSKINNSHELLDVPAGAQIKSPQFSDPE